MEAHQLLLSLIYEIFAEKERAESRFQAEWATCRQWWEDGGDPSKGLSNDELHQRQCHPDYEYRTTTGQRKAWPSVDEPPWDPEKGAPDPSWELNITSVDPDAFERFDYTEERYWRRPKAEPSVWVRSVPDHIRRLAQAYGIDVDQEDDDEPA